MVDQDIYEARPSIVIGTVDKFAMMAWRPEARRLFGLGDDGSREVSPPGLIIQDELHLISGPLGSMVGLYEPVIDDLCTDKRGVDPVPPKIIASTATIRRYEDQIRGLFGREKVALFPPHGLEEGHSFFAEPATLDRRLARARTTLPRRAQRVARFDPDRAGARGGRDSAGRRRDRRRPTATATGPTSTS